MSVKVIICDPIAEEGTQKLNEAGFQVRSGADLGAEDLREAIEAYQGMVVRSGTTVDKELLDAATELEIVVRAGVGLDNIDLEYAAEVGVEVRNTPAASSNSVAELAIGHMISLARGIPRGTSSLREGEWIKSELKGTELAGKTLGIIGAGRIGSLVAEKGASLGMDPIAYDKYVSEPPVSFLEMVEKEEVLERADFLTLHIPFVESEGPTVAEEQLRSMKETAYLINCARGGVVDQDDLYEALKGGEIAGAALDVFPQEPPPAEPLFQLPNLSLTPHIGASTAEAQRRVGEEAAGELIDFFQGED